MGLATEVLTMELAPAVLVMAGLAITGLATGELARAGLATAGTAISGLGSRELPGTRQTAARAGPDVARVAAADGIQRANRFPRQKVLRADFIAARSH
ncbi:MAG: hypothetical protein DLM62_12530 [Pseudonocardiales bacterium]|nr:MAG: hypothetical protein DLM62_12530 [Pseudonocardiales bacterium]